VTVRIAGGADAGADAGAGAGGGVDRGAGADPGARPRAGGDGVEAISAGCNALASELPFTLECDASAAAFCTAATERGFSVDLNRVLGTAFAPCLEACPSLLVISLVARLRGTGPVAGLELDAGDASKAFRSLTVLRCFFTLFSAVFCAANTSDELKKSFIPGTLRCLLLVMDRIDCGSLFSSLKDHVPSLYVTSVSVPSFNLAFTGLDIVSSHLLRSLFFYWVCMVLAQVFFRAVGARPLG
jgi:hypothetical protein